MICIYGPYEITSNLEDVGEYTFIDNELSRRVTLFAGCEEVVNSPCADAVALHIKDDCPGGCKVYWYECPSDMGRQYTILPTPCGVKISSFEDGLISVDGCDATLFGLDTFCFGKIYTNLGTFDSPDQSICTFEFDGHIFTVTGNLGDCNELYNCSECQTAPAITAFEDLPTPPDDISAPEAPSNDEVISDIDTPETEIIPAEGRVEWHWNTTTTPFGQDIICETEKPLISWAGGTSVKTCESNDNPSIATLPSGHTVVAYENRGEDGITKITVAILSSSVRENIRSHRKLGTGTQVNNLVESEGVATFIVYEDMNIPVDENGLPASGEKIGFLTGPLKGSLFTITKLTRFRNGDVIRHEFNFTAGINVEFPDKNHIYDVNWFIVDNQGNADLPSSENITTILDLPNHIDGEGNSVPVSNPSIAVAQNNKMVSHEQCIYVAYQAFEDNQWRVYLREIVLGTDEAVAPSYISPYLFTNEIRQVQIMTAPTVEAMGNVPDVTFYDESFSGAGLVVGTNISTTGRWEVLTDAHIPQWFWFNQDINNFVSYLTMPLVLSDTQGQTGATGLPETECERDGGTACSAAFNSQITGDLGGDDSIFIFDHTRSFAISTIPTQVVASNFHNHNAINLSFKMRFHVVVNTPLPSSSAWTEYPDLWFIIGRSDPTNVNFSEGYRLQIRRGQGLSTDTMNNIPSQANEHKTCDDACNSSNGCFIFQLYKDTSPKWVGGQDWWFDRNVANGSQDDLPTRVIWKCIENEANLGQPGDYSFNDWNEWRVNTYVRGFFRFFELYLTHPNGTEVLMATFREWEESISPQDSTNSYTLGPYHGFGVSQSMGQRSDFSSKHQVLIDSFSAKTIPSSNLDKIYFLEDFCERDGTMQSAPTSNVELGTPMMLDEPITTNTDYVGSDLHYQTNPWADRFYPVGNTVYPFMFEGSFQLGPSFNQNFPPTGWASLLRLRPITNDRDPTGGVSSLDSISMVISVNRQWAIHDGAWPHIWLVGRLSTHELGDARSRWFDRYRLRISRFNCVSDYAALGLSQGDKVWRISAYNSGSGLKTDTPALEKILIIGTDTDLEWIDYATTGGGSNSEGQSIWNYFKIDMYDSDGQVIFDVYVGDDTPTTPTAKMHPDDVQFTLLTSLAISPIQFGIDGGFFGAAFFSGTSNESAEGLIDPATSLGDDYRSSAHINHITLSTIGAAGEASVGACCRSIGGCDESVLNTDCLDPDIWKVNQTCGEAACAGDFPVGAGCTTDGNCHDNITLAEATAQGIPNAGCSGCEWIVGKDCNPSAGGSSNPNYRDCPLATGSGACCRPLDHECLNDVTFAECTTYWGDPNHAAQWFGAGQSCTVEGINSTDCAAVGTVGACCLPSGCVINSLADCQGFGGIFRGTNTDCVAPAPCPSTGACCDGVGGCTLTTLTDCLGAGSTFKGVGVSCTPDPCLQQNGACCWSTGGCADTIESGCTSGTWLYDASCIDDPCPIAVGACCDPFSGICEDEVSQANCLNNGKTFFGEGSICAYVNCDAPTGACCVGSNCFGGKTQQECTDLNGEYKGNFSHCIEGICLEGIDQDPYLAISINYKPEDLWVIETAPNEYITRVLYHMQEEIVVSSIQLGQQEGNANNTIDFMFLVDHSASMTNPINQVAVGIPALAENMVSKGLDVRFGFSIFGRGVTGIPNIPTSSTCNCRGTDTDMADGLQAATRCKDGNPDQLEGEPFTTDGFTRNVDYMQRAINCWGVQSGATSPWSAIQFIIESSQFAWRPGAAKFVFFVTDTHPNENCTSCGSWSLSQSDATNVLLNTGTVMIPVVNLSTTCPQCPMDNSAYLAIAESTGWTEGLLDSSLDDYGDIFEQVVNAIDSILRIDHATVIERASEGTDPTYLNKGEVIISYDGDLSDLWTFNKTDLEFHDAHVPFPGTDTKQLINFPFNLAAGRVYGIDTVHIQGNPNHWVSFKNEGALIYDHPNVGHRESGTSENPVLISTNSARPKVYVNNRNQVMVAYENYSTGISQIEIKGTGDFHQNSITGPKAKRIVRLLNQDDFAYRHTITLSGEGINQLCDFVIDNSDIVHIVWQSSRDGYWEIYYGNSFNLFDPVRITKADSRSSHPSIDVDETGSIFVVYHDDRFGPFNIMLSSKDEERVIPLLEQDAYFASLRTEYTHYTNILPVFLDNPSGEAPDLGRFWANKDKDGAGNDSETYIYQVDETTGTPSDGVDLDSISSLFRPTSIAFSSTTIWGIGDGGELYRLGQITDDDEVAITSPLLVGTVDLVLDGFNSSTILDMAVDKFDRIWVLIHEIEDFDGPGFSMTPSGLPLVRTFTVDHRLRLEYISGFNAATIARGIVKENDADGPDGGSLTITSDNKFFITWDNNAEVTLSASDYPDILESVATFNFTDIGNLAPAITPVAMTADASDVLFVVTSDNDLYTISKLTGGTTLQASLTTGSGAESILPVGTTSGIAYQSLDVETTGTAEFFHVRIDFYDNITFEGDMFLSVDSRDNLEAFINDETLDDPYLDPYTPFGMDARGIFLNLDEIGIVFFDATHFVPGFSRLSQPYSFEPNQTYFPRVFLINGDGGVRESGVPQPNSFSCTKCSRFGNNNFNTSACSYSFVMPNVEADTSWFNFQIDFYADTGKQHLIRRFEATPGSDDLQYMEVDNKPATDQWSEFGLPIFAGDSVFVQIHPVSDPAAGFLCGVAYTVQVNECHTSNETCSDFSKISPSNWSASLVGDRSNLTIDDQIDNNEVMLSLSMKLINNKLSIVWRTPNGSLNFAQLDDDKWTSQTVIPSGTVEVFYCDLFEINGLPSISFVTLKTGNTVEGVLTLDGGTWNEWPNMQSFQAGILVNPRSLLEYENAPMVAYISRGDGFGQPAFVLNSGRSAVWNTEPSCRPPFETTSGGSCTTTLATINGLPAVAWIGGGLVRYGTWDTDNEVFSNLDIVSAGESVVWGKIALAEVDGQPAIAYIQVVGSLGLLKYKRFNGDSWIDIPTNGQVRDFNKHVAMTVINGQPYIAYSVKTSATTSQLRCVFHNGTKFIDDIVEDDLNQVDHVVDIAEFNNEPAIIISANPFRVYFFRTLPSQSVNEIRPVFLCECSSKIFTDRLTHLHEVARWESSAHGFADTPVTDSPKDSLRPIMRTRKTSAAIVIWEDHNASNNCTDPPCIRAATFRNVNQDQLRASGTKSWFDYDFGISGQDSDLALDLYERVNAIYEKPKPRSGEGLHGRQISKDELPGNELYGKVCDFSIAAEEAPDDPNDPGGCDISALENNVVSFDQFISNQIVRKIRVKEEFVQYHTYNVSGTLTPIVSTCNIALEIHGTPEIVALRFRNENKIVWGPWCPWSPQISDFVMEKEHIISGGSGIKEICIQAMTYVGITTEFCLPIVADYETIVFETRFYKNTDSEGNKITNFSDVANGFFPSNLDAKLVPLPLSDGISVASLDIAGGGNPCPEGTECADDEICIGGRCVAKIAKILVEIVTNQELSEEVINFDVVQQGTNDQRGVSNKGKNNDGRVLYRGDFAIEREDKVFNTDGLARVNPTFPSACEDSSSESVGVSDIYTRDIFNETGEDITVEGTEITDSLADFRQTTTGHIGVSLDIRSSEDPYFVFGDPDYSLRQKDGQRLGVPFQIAETEIAIGSDVDQDGGFCSEPPGGCPGTFVWQPWPVCQCLPPSG